MVKIVIKIEKEIVCNGRIRKKEMFNMHLLPHPEKEAVTDFVLNRKPLPVESMCNLRSSSHHIDQG
jgi:hypothetical protein